MLGGEIAMRSEYDVTVVGGGPAGAAAALAAARCGLSVLVLEARLMPREKLCGGLLSRKTVQIVNRLYGASDKDLIRSGIINYSSHGYGIVFNNTLLCDDSYDYPFHFVDRAVLDAWMLEVSSTAGAEVVTGDAVTAADLKAGQVTLASGRTVRSRFIIGADGANSVVRRAFPVDRRSWGRALASTIEVRIPRSMYPREVDKPEVHIGPIAEGYGWVFPNRETVVVGIGGRARKGENLAVLFRRFLADLNVPDAASIPLKGHPLPFGNYVTKPVYNTGLLAGDAGGLVEPVFGEGIYFAIRSGEAAGLAVAHAVRTGESPEPCYMRHLRSDVYAEIRNSKRMQRALYFFDRYGMTPLVKLGVRMGRSVLLDVIHGRRSFCLFRKNQNTGC